MSADLVGWPDQAVANQGSEGEIGRGALKDTCARARYDSHVLTEPESGTASETCRMHDVRLAFHRGD